MTSANSYNQASLTLNAQSNCTGTATWSFSWSYQAISDGTIYVGSPSSTSQTINQPVTYLTPVGVGGQSSTNVYASFGASVNLVEYVAGSTIPNATVVGKMTSLYGGATPNLLVGIAFVESSCMQFTFRSHPAYVVEDYWPLEGGGGNYVGLMQVPPSQSTLFDWTSNAASGSSVYGQKLTAAASYSNQQTGANPTLPALTPTQQEDEALWQYAGYLSSGHYYLPNAGATGWVVTSANANGVAYVQNVRNHAGTNCN